MRLMQFLEGLATKRALFTIAAACAGVLFVASLMEGVAWLALLTAAITGVNVWAAMRQPPAFESRPTD